MKIIFLTDVFLRIHSIHIFSKKITQKFITPQKSKNEENYASYSKIPIQYNKIMGNIEEF